MKTLLLAAGRSRRVKPIEDKNFLKFFGLSLIEFQISRLSAAGFKVILLVGGGHNQDQLKAAAQRQMEADPVLKVEVFEQKDLEEGMAGAVLAVEEAVGDEDLFIVSSNDRVDVDAYDAIKTAIQGEGDSFLLAHEVKEYFPGGYLKMEGDRITGIIEKPEPGTEPSQWINVVLHVHKKPAALFSALKKNTSTRDDRYEQALDQLMKERIFKAVPYAGFWQPIKHPWHILDLMMHIFKRVEGKVHSSAQIAETAVIKGDVVIEEGVKIMDHATIVGPAYIGKNSVIANNALVRESILGENCVVGYSTEVARSFIGDDCWFHSNYVGDTIMGNDVSFGAGAICANLRLDEKEILSGGIQTGRNKLGPILGDHIRVGVQTSLMPGVRIGSNTMITSGLVIAEDIEAGKFVSGGRPILEIKDNKAVLSSEDRAKMKEKL
jgi:bifunctional UDP-N-acetylglucosamine pyrophosphorylase/glucosamine-1-phosphate N-acetyltransferase